MIQHAAGGRDKSTGYAVTARLGGFYASSAVFYKLQPPRPSSRPYSEQLSAHGLGHACSVVGEQVIQFPVDYH
jgi:hypothetical protein